MSEKAYIEFRTHAVQIIRTDSDIRCFKFARRGHEAICDFDIFQNESEATEYILKPFPNNKAYIEFR